MSVKASFSAVVLAAGLGSRMGHVPKGALLLDGQPILIRLVSALFSAGINDVVVVLGAYAAQLQPLLAGLPVKVVINPYPERDLAFSQHLGLAAVSPSHDAVMMVLADQVLINASDLQEAMAAWSQRDAHIDCLYPEVQGQRGHPVTLSPSAVKQVLAQGDGVGVRTWQRQHAQHVAVFASDNVHFVKDVDTFEDVQAIDAQLGGGRLQWAGGPISAE